MSYAHIVVATDFSEPSERALDVANKLAERFGARVTLFHSYSILPPSAVYPDALWPAAHIDVQLREDARRSLEALHRERLPNIERVDTVAVPHPNAAIAISDYATVNGADLVMAGTHGRTGLAHVLLGSVAEALVRHAPCPVLVVRGNVERFPGHVLACTDFSEE
ncbi:MAG TPA: universal stress protein, partial [Polyangiaceae bacterium]|nr:universal stress protein [Polyangiaceae bacterium]